LYLNQGKNIVQVVSNVLFNNRNKHAKLLKQEVFVLHIRSMNYLDQARYDLWNVRNTVDTQRLEHKCNCL